VRVHAELGARASFREAARVMSVLPPTGKAANHPGIRRRLARTANLLQVLDNASAHRMSRVEGGPMVVALDGAHIRAVPRFQVRHFEVMVRRSLIGVLQSSILGVDVLAGVTVLFGVGSMSPHHGCQG
jgi:hypothetical protein